MSDLDARALKARLDDRERVIAAFRERCLQLEFDVNVMGDYILKLEAVAAAARQVKDHPLIRLTMKDETLGKFPGSLWIDMARMLDTLAALDPPAPAVGDGDAD